MLKKHKYNAQSKNGKRSVLEDTCFNLLTENGILFDYEPLKIILLPKFTFCSYEAKKGVIKEQCSVRDMTYTPDFVDPDIKWLIETKGMSLPDFILKWKLFKQWLSINQPYCKAYIAHSKKDLISVIEMIKKDVNDRKN